MKELIDATNVYTEKAKEEYYDQWVVKYNNGTITKEEVNALQDPFLTTGWRANTTVDNFLLSAWDTNPDFQDAAYYINTWSTEGDTDGSNFKVPFFEYFGNPLPAKTLTATMNGLEPGKYDVTAWVRVAPADKAATSAKGVTLQVNEGDSVNVCTGEQFDCDAERFFIKEVTATGVVAEDGVLKIQFHVAENNDIHWLSFKNVKFNEHQLTPEEIAALELEAAKAEFQAAITAAKAIETEGRNGADALATAITDAETAQNATDATLETIAAAKEALAQAISVFNKANFDADLVEIAQSQGKELDNFARAELVEGTGYNTYTANADLTIAIKMMNVDVKDCDYVVIKFAEPVAAGWNLAFWSNQDLVAVPEGATEFKYVFADDPKCGVENGVLPQICMMTFFGGFQAPLVAKVEGIYKHQVPVEITRWDFTNWSEATIANLKADAAASKVTGWSDVEKVADAEAGAEPTEASKDNCFWATIAEGGELTANGVVIEELKGLKFNSAYSAKRSLAIAVNYPSTSLGDYAGPSYLWLGGGGKNIIDCFTIPAVKGGSIIKMGVESHKIADARGVKLFVDGTELTDPQGIAVSAPKAYTEQFWQVPAGDAVNVVVQNTNGCHIYFIDLNAAEEYQTAISTVKSNNKLNGTIYNMNGQKMNKAQKGLYIINGKKVIK